jgi:hypothetical protein
MQSVLLSVSLSLVDLLVSYGFFSFGKFRLFYFNLSFVLDMNPKLILILLLVVWVLD